MQSTPSNRLWIASLILVALIGLTLRIERFAGFNGVGFDENLYRKYVNYLVTHGVSDYPELVDSYREGQRKLSFSILPPVRAHYILMGWAWVKLLGGDTLKALKHVATLYTCLSFLLSLLVVWRMKRPRGEGEEVPARGWALALFALMAVAPTQLHMSQHALVDGVFGFWALLSLWLLWENLQHPDHSGWLVALMGSLAVMVTTKENAAFAYLGMLAILAGNRWLGFGKITRSLCMGMVLGPFLGVVFLVLIAGGIPELIDTYQLSVSKNFTLPYAIKTGDGPWYRYLVDLMVVSPVILVLALGRLFELKARCKQELFVLLFILGSYLIMCNLKYGMNLRYANMWDLPLRFLAFGCLVSLAQRIASKYRELFLTLSVLAICAIELRQYYLFTVVGGLYELVTADLLYAVKMLKL